VILIDSNKIKFFVPKLKNRVDSKKNYLWKYCDIEQIAMCGFHCFADAAAFKLRLQTILGVYNVTLLEDICSDDKDLIQFAAEQALRHEFDLLGSGSVKLDPIDWHTDFKCGARWKKGFYKEIQTPKGADIKMPWELSRCQQLLWLGEAWLLTGEEKYAKEVVDETNWWIDDNPLMYTVNWKCAMDVAFRAVNWLFALNMITDYDGFDNCFTEKVSRSLWQHGFFIRNNLEKIIPYSNNHYTSDLVGLLYLGELFAETRKGRSWLRFAKKEYCKETLQQVLPSGVHYERSVSYHRMMTEMLSYPVYLLKRMGETVPKEVMERIGNMYSYIATYTKPNGLAPLIADNDDGRFVPFLRRDFRKHGYLNDNNSVENRFIAAGMQPLFCKQVEKGRLFEDAEVAIIRQHNDYLFINHGGYSKNPKEFDSTIGTHTHNDLLSFELNLRGQDIIVDAGTYLYTSSESDRNAFRSTSKHNTIVVDGEEQNGFVSSFSLKRNVHKGKLQQMEEGVYKGDYTTIKGQMHHCRQFSFDNGKLVITDYITKTGNGHTAKFYLHFAEGLLPVLSDKMLTLDNGVKVTFKESPSFLEIIDDTLSPSFGVQVPSKTAVATFEFDNEINIETTIK